MPAYRAGDAVDVPKTLGSSRSWQAFGTPDMWFILTPHAPLNGSHWPLLFPHPFREFSVYYYIIIHS